MNCSQRVLLASVASLLLSCNRQLPNPPQDVVSPSTAPPAVSTTTIQEGLKSGTFTAGAHPTQGTASLIMVEGKHYLQLDQAFQSDQGPDLFVLLHKAPNPKTYNAGDYINLGRLQATQGEQQYLIPEDANLDRYKSVVIWCQRFNVTFGYAPFAPPG